MPKAKGTCARSYTNALSNTPISNPVIVSGDLNDHTGSKFSVDNMLYSCPTWLRVPIVGHTDARSQMLLDTTLAREWTVLNVCAELPTHTFRRGTHYRSNFDYILLNQGAAKHYQYASIAMDALDEYDCHMHLLLCITAKVVKHSNTGLPT